MAFRDVFQQAPISFIEHETSLPRALLLGELSSGCETERLDKGRLSSERNNAGVALYNLSVLFASLDATVPWQERLWHSVTFSSKTKSVSSKTKPLCQGLPYQERLPRPGEVARKCRKGNGWRADARLRGWTKDAFRVSGERRCCSVQPLRHLRSRSMPPPLVGEALAFRDVFQQTQIGFIENEISLPRAPLIGKTPPAGGGGTEVPKGERLSPQAAEGFYYIL